MLDIDCSQLSKKISDEIFNDVKEYLDDDESSKVKFAHHSQFIIVNSDDLFLYGQLIGITNSSLRDKVMKKYASEYSKKEKEHLLENGVQIEHTKYNL